MGDMGQLFLQILAVVSNSISELLGMLPNPDPFPEIIAEMEFNAESGFVVTYYWLDQFLSLIHI